MGRAEGSLTGGDRGDSSKAVEVLMRQSGIGFRERVHAYAASAFRSGSQTRMSGAPDEPGLRAGIVSVSECRLDSEPAPQSWKPVLQEELV